MKTTSKLRAIPATLMTLALLGSCTRDTDRETAETTIQRDVTEYRDTYLQDSLEESFMQTLLEIDRNLQMVHERSGTITMGPETPGESGITPKERILRNIQLINTLMAENKEKIDQLNSNLKRFRVENSRLKKLVTSAEEEVKRYEAELTAYKQQLSDQQFSITMLNQEIDRATVKNQQIEDMLARYDEEINTAYYAMGTYKELERKGVLEDRNAISFKKPEVNEFVEDDQFVRIDIREVRTIPVNSKKAVLMTSHPSASYELKKENGTVTELEIKDPQRFWKKSKYLVLAQK